MEDVRLDGERDSHWRIIFEYNEEEWTMRKKFYMLRSGVST